MKPRDRSLGTAWNVVILTGGGLVMRAIRDLSHLGDFRSTPHGGVVVGMVDGGDVLAALTREQDRAPETFRHVQRAIPIERVVPFARDDVTETLCAALANSGPRIAGKRFYVRCRLRGMEGRLEGRAVERAIGGYLIELAAAATAPASVCFDDPQLVLGIEVIAASIGYAFHDEVAIKSPLIRQR